MTVRLNPVALFVAVMVTPGSDTGKRLPLGAGRHMVSAAGCTDMWSGRGTGATHTPGESTTHATLGVKQWDAREDGDGRI